MKKLSKYKIVSIILTIAVCLSLVPLSVFAVNPQAPLPETPEISAELLASLPETLDADAIAGKGHISRLYAEETDLNSVVFDNGNGAQSVYIFGEDIKYIDKDGKTRDKSNKLQSVTGGYTNPYNDIQVFYPTEISSGITVNYKDYTVNMVPMPDISSNEMSTTSFATLVTEDKRTTPDAVKYNNVFGANTAVEYIQQFTGFKEIITVEEYTGQTEFAFMITTNGLTLALNEGTAELTDPATGSMVGKLGDLAMWDSIDAYYTGEYTIEEIKPNDIYVVVIDATEILTNPDTVYPVYVDPDIILWQPLSLDIQDVTVYDGTASMGANFGAVQYHDLGKTSLMGNNRGTGRTFIKIPSLISLSDQYTANDAVENTNDNTSDPNKRITGVHIVMPVAPLGLGSASIDVYMCNSFWPELSLTSANCNYNSTKGMFVSNTLVPASTSNPNNTSVKNMSINITYPWVRWNEYAKRGADDQVSGVENNGVILQLVDEQKAIRLYSSEHTTLGYRPYLVFELNTYNKNVDMVYQLRNVGTGELLRVEGAFDKEGAHLHTNSIPEPDLSGYEPEEQKKITDEHVYRNKYSSLFRFWFDQGYSEYRITPICSRNGYDLALQRKVRNGVETGEVTLQKPSGATRNQELFTIALNETCQDGKYFEIQKAWYPNKVLTVDSDGNVTMSEDLADSATDKAMQLWELIPVYEEYGKRHYYRYLQGLVYPIESSYSNWNKVTSGYGWRDYSDPTHQGIDIDVGVGTPVKSACPSGQVIRVRTNNAESNGGKYVAVRSDQLKAYNSNEYLVFIYMHLSTIKVAEGDLIQDGDEGDQIQDDDGIIGTSGGDTPHLHFTVAVGSKYEIFPLNFSTSLDPLMFFQDQVTFEHT